VNKGHVGWYHNTLPTEDCGAEVTVIVIGKNRHSGNYSENPKTNRQAQRTVARQQRASKTTMTFMGLGEFSDVDFGDVTVSQCIH